MDQLPDIQKTEPEIKIRLNRVGISKLKMPIYISERNGNDSIQHSVAKISCYVDLEPNIKGISMSRLPIIIQNKLNEPLNNKMIKTTAEEIRVISDARECQLTYEFDYFTIKNAPISHESGILSHKVIFHGVKRKDSYKFTMTVETIGTSLCPCSKEISKYGAHNQKCYVSIQTMPKLDKIVWIEDLIDVVDKSVSCEIFSVLKRPDEKWVTEKAYNNARFVEDIARKTYSNLIENNKLHWFEIKVASDESIHVHRAEAIIDSPYITEC